MVNPSPAKDEIPSRKSFGLVTAARSLCNEAVVCTVSLLWSLGTLAVEARFLEALRLARGIAFCAQTVMHGESKQSIQDLCESIWTGARSDAVGTPAKDNARGVHNNLAIMQQKSGNQIQRLDGTKNQGHTHTEDRETKDSNYIHHSIVL